MKITDSRRYFQGAHCADRKGFAIDPVETGFLAPECRAKRDLIFGS
jgi:hypothetical protein